MKGTLWKEPRHYKRNGKKYVSVTEYLKVVNKPALVQWSANMTRDFMLKQTDEIRTLAKTQSEQGFADLYEGLCQKARLAHRDVTTALDIGTIVHTLLEDIGEGRTVDIDLATKDEPEEVQKAVRKAMDGYYKWVEEDEIEHIPGMNEVVLYDDALEIGGTMDAGFHRKGTLCVGDYKSSKGIYPEMIIQASKYKRMFEEQTGELVERAYILRFDKSTGEFESYLIPDTEGPADIFDNAIVPLWRYLYGD